MNIDIYEELGLGPSGSYFHSTPSYKCKEIDSYGLPNKGGSIREANGGHNKAFDHYRSQIGVNTSWQIWIIYFDAKEI